MRGRGRRNRCVRGRQRHLVVEGPQPTGVASPKGQPEGNVPSFSSGACHPQTQAGARTSILHGNTDRKERTRQGRTRVEKGASKGNYQEHTRSATIPLA